MRAWNDCLPMQTSDWLGSECGRVLLRSMTLDWLYDNGRGGREWLGAVGVGLDTWHDAVGGKDAVLNLPGSSWCMGIMNGLPKIKPSLRAQDEDPEEAVIRLGMRQWEDALAMMPDEHVDALAQGAASLVGQSEAVGIVDTSLDMKLPVAMTLASVAMMGLAVMEVVGLEQLAIVGGNRLAPWHGYLGNSIID